MILLLSLGFQDIGQQPAIGQIRGRVTDETGAVLPGVSVVLQPTSGGTPAEASTDESGDYTFANVAPGRYQLTFTLMTFTPSTLRDVVVGAVVTPVNAVLHMALSAEVTVAARQTFVDMANVDNPAEDLVGIAQSASQGAITAAQLEVRPLMRVGEVLETVPGMIASSHAGGGKANQYFLRGFNLDHGTDFAQTIAGMPVNLPSHAHGQGYSDINFMMPELVSGVQYSKGPYFADQGDFATAGCGEHQLRHVARSAAASRRSRRSGLCPRGGCRVAGCRRRPSAVAIEGAHNDGPWVQPDDFEKLNGVIRYSRGDAIDGFVADRHGISRPVDVHRHRSRSARSTGGLIDRFGTLDPTDGGATYRYSVSGDWQHVEPPRRSRRSRGTASDRT